MSGLHLESTIQHPSIISVSPSGAEPVDVGERIVFTFDQPIMCGDQCIAILVAGNRAQRVQLDVVLTAKK